MQHGLEQWRDYLSDKPLPVLRQTKIEVQRLIDQSQLSITQYAGPVFFDAAFCALIFKQVNRQRTAAGRTPLTTLDNALSHLGRPNFQALLNNTPFLEELGLPDKSSSAYLRVMSQACHCALQAKDWAEQRQVMQPEEMRVAALLQNIPELMLWCYGETVMAEIEYLWQVKKQSYEEAAKQVLGCTIRELGAALAETWSLPEIAIEALQSRKDNFTLATGVALASEMARVAAINWYGKAAQDVIQQIAKYKGKTTAEIERELHLTAVDISEIMLQNNYLSPARLLPQLAGDDYIDEQFVLQDKLAEVEKKPQGNRQDNLQKQPEKPTPQTEKPEKVKPEKVKPEKVKPQKDKPEKLNPVDAAEAAVTPIKQQQTAAVSEELASAIKQFQQMVASSAPAQELIECAVKTCLLCGVQRCVFVIYLADKKRLVSRFTAQQSADIAIRNLVIPTDSSQLFGVLLEKNSSLFLNESNRSKYWHLIADTVKLTIGVKAFFVMPVSVNNRVMGLLYADKIKGELTQAEFVQFKAVCRLLNKGITLSALKKKK